MRNRMFKLVGAAAGVSAALAFASSATAANYLVLYKGEAVPADGPAAVRAAGGTVVAAYDAIGVVVARSEAASFRSELVKDNRVEAAVATAGLAGRTETAVDTDSPTAAALPSGPVDDKQEPLFPLQWNLRQIHVPEAHAITGGSKDVLVGDIDSGIDYTHPDLASNVDFANSADCRSGAPNQDPAAWFDQQGHGTATAGVIAAAANGIGIVGVAPNVRIAAIKAMSDAGYVLPEAVVCSFMWAASHGVDVTNNSYWADPFYFNCRNDPDERAVWAAERRAIRFAIRAGVVVVAAAGNQRDDLAHPTRDVLSPDFPPGSEESRDVTNACAVVPVEVPGVVGVSAVGSLSRKTRDSNYGSGVIDVTAPTSTGSQRSPLAPNGLMISTAPASSSCTVVDPTTGAKYCFVGGTSISAPHVAGVAALLRSRHPTMPPGAVAAVVEQTADAIACPDEATLALYLPFLQLSNGQPQTCTGGPGQNSWYGHGQVDALSAVAYQP